MPEMAEKTPVAGSAVETEIEQQRRACEQRFEALRKEEEMRFKRTRAAETWKFNVAEIVGPRYSRVTLENFEAKTTDQSAAVLTIKDYLDNFPAHCAIGAGLLFTGPVGTGKDHLACASLRVISTKYLRTTRWVSCNELFGEFRDLIKRGAQTEAEVVAKYTSSDVLVLSDPLPPVGVLSEFQIGVLLRIVQIRYDWMRPTFATLNVASSEELSRRVGPQVADRLRHNAVVVKCNWPSYRTAQG